LAILFSLSRSAALFFVKLFNKAFSLELGNDAGVDKIFGLEFVGLGESRG
jgi:hypothetical protein